MISHETSCPTCGHDYDFDIRNEWGVVEITCYICGTDFDVHFAIEVVDISDVSAKRESEEQGEGGRALLREDGTPTT